jgi:hypothetical protein
VGKSWDQYRLGEPYEAPRRKGLKTFAIVAALLAITILPAMAAKGGQGAGGGGKGHGGSGSTGGSCTASAPRVSIDNTYAWASKGSWGMPGQKLSYAIDVFNNDLGCGSSTFAVDLAAPDGFAVSMPTSTITLGSASTGYVWAYVTSPSSAADGDYALNAAVKRGSDLGGGDKSYYKVYSSDTTPPKLYWENPTDGSTVSGRSLNIGFASNDDHAVKTVEILLDGNVVDSMSCDNVASDCQISYTWSIGRASGQHTATFRSTDWMGNVASDKATFTVG